MDNGVIHIIPEWLEFLFLAFCTGTGMCSIWVVAGEATLPLRTWRLFVASAAAMTASSIGDLVMRSAEMAGQPLSDVLALLPTVVTRTHLGHVSVLRIFAEVLLLALLWVGWRHRDRKFLPASLLGILAIIAMTKSASGHAADLGDLSMAEMVDWLHLVAVCCWGGGLLVLAIAVLPPIPEPDEHADLIVEIGGRFSRIAGYAVGLIAVTAFFNGRSFVGSIDALWRSPYGWTVSVKIALFLVLVSLGAYNRFVALPFLRKEAGIETAPLLIERVIPFPRFYPIAQEFIYRVRLEALLIVVVLLCGALLRHQVPARHAAHQDQQGKAPVHSGMHH